MDAASKTADAFWEDFYLTKRTTSTGKPTGALQRFAQDLPPGRSLDLGASHGDDVIWLAERGWQALGVDISPVATERARQRAASLNLVGHAEFRAMDLSAAFPAGQFDLVTAFYFQSPLHLPRAKILGQAAQAVAPGGHLLVISHAAPPPWSNHRQEDPFPTVESELEAIGYKPANWTAITAKLTDRPAKLPSGETAMLQDTVIMLRRN